MIITRLSLVLPLLFASQAMAGIAQFEANPMHLEHSMAKFSTFAVQVHQRIIPSPTVYRDSLLVATGKGGIIQSGKVVRISAQGKILWSTKLPNIVMTQPLVAYGVVLAGLGGNRMYFRNPDFDCHPGFPHEIVGLSVKSGKILWRVPTRCQDMPTGVVYHQHFYIVSGGGTLRELDPRTGRCVWSMPLTGGAAMSSAALDRGIIYFGTDNIRNGNHRFYAIDLAKHHILWSHNFPDARNLGEPSPVVAHGVVYTVYLRALPYSFFQAESQYLVPVATFEMVAMDASTGKILYRKVLETLYNTGEAATQMILRNGSLQLSFLWDTLRHHLQDLTGFPPATRFQRQPKPGKKAPGISNPPLTYWHGRIYLEPREAKRIFCVDAHTGTILWEEKTGGASIANPNIWHGRLYIVNHRGNLFVFSAISGKQELELPLGTGVVGPSEVLLTPNRLIVGGGSGVLISIPRPTVGKKNAPDSGAKK
jgi:alcohol dehydrogenase (cytochrome c)